MLHAQRDALTHNKDNYLQFQTQYQWRNVKISYVVFVYYVIQYIFYSIAKQNASKHYDLKG
jgi:hypothetical protein